MASPRLVRNLSQLKHGRKAREIAEKLGEKRKLHLEPLEDRRLMAVGPSLVTVTPNSGVFLNNNDTLNVAPRDITFRFAQGNDLDPTTLAKGFVVTSAGNDHILGNTDDQVVSPGFLGLGDSGREVVMRFASTLPDNAYSVTLVGATDLMHPTWSPIKDKAGNVFNSGDPNNPNLTIRFGLDSGAKISAIVPQPITRNTTAGPQFNALSQSYNTIDVYYDQQMNLADVTQPGFYRLIDATNGGITLPTSVKYSDDATLTVLNSGPTLLSYNGVSATAALNINNQTTRVTVTNAGSANAGSFTLTINGATTGPIAANGATVANVLNVLNAVPALKGNVAVVAGPGGTGIVEQFDITFVGSMTGRSATVAFNPIGTGTAGSAANTVNATNLLASGGSGAAGSVQNNLNSIPGLAGKVTVTGPAGGPYNIQYTGALSGTNVRLVANAVPTAVVTAASQTMTLATTGTTLLSFNGVNASLPLSIVTGNLGTPAAAVTSNLNTIPALNGKVSVTGPAGGPFTITITNPSVSLLSSLVKSSTSNATFKTNTQTLNLITGGITNLAFNGANATSPLTVVTGANGTTAAAVQTNLSTISGLAGNFTVAGANGGPFTITYSGTAATTNASLVATNPAGVVVSITDQPKATLTFASAIQSNSNMFKLEVGTTTEPNDRITTAQHVGNSMTSSLSAFIGDNLSLANDVDIYRFDVQSDVTDFSINVAPANGSSLDTFVRIFQADGTPYAPQPSIDNPGAGVADDASNISLPAGVYYIGVSSKNNIDYDPNVNGTATGGTATGAYSIKVSFTDTPATVDDTTTFNNSSFDSPTVLGVLGNGGKSVSGATIAPSPDLAQQYGVQLPGAGDAPGERNIPFQGHLTTVPGRLPDPNSGVETITYDFQQVYGYTPQGQQFTNAITEAQKQRAREAFELWGRYLGVQFKEVPSEQIADMTIATGDPRAIAPTISTGTGNANNGTNGIAGTASIVPTSDATNMFTHVVTDASNTSPIVITSANHGLAEGSKVNINGVLSNTAANGVWTVHVIDSNRFELNNSVGNNPYGGGGTFGTAKDLTGAADVAINYTQQNQIVITSAAHGLSTGQFVYINGVQGMTSANGMWKVVVLDQDNFFLQDAQGDSQGNGIYLGGGTWTPLNISKGVAIVNALVNWDNSQYGGEYFKTVMHEIGHLLGLGDNFEAPALTIMNGGEVPSQAANNATAEPVFPGDADIVYGQTVHRPESRDIDLYQFSVTEPGLFRSETIAERLSNGSLLNTVLTLYQETETNGVKSRTQVARNDDYYGNDSYLEVHLEKGTYYLAVTSVGNTDFDPTIPDTGFGGRTQGAYNLSMSLKPDGGTVSMRDATGAALDGDAENNPGGAYQFWFQANTPTNTVYVDKTPPVSPSGALGSITNPYTGLVAALAQVNTDINPATAKKIVRIVGNGGTDGNVNTFIDDKTYNVGFKDANRTQVLSVADGGDFQVPKGATVMIDAGAAFKMRRSNLSAGTTPQGLVSAAGGSIQVLGTPNTPVIFTSYADDSIGGDSDGPSSGPMGGDYGGIVYRNDSDHERDYLSANNPLGLVMPVFLNYVNHAMMTYGGGKVTVDSVEDVYDPIYLDSARPSLSFNTIEQSANAGASASPNTFDDDGLPSPSGTLVAFDDRRIGPDIHDNTVVNNSLNGLFVRVRTQAGSPIDYVDVPTRWNDTDIVHIVSENLEIAGTPGGSMSSGADRATTTQTDGRLRIDPGMTVKLGGSRIEAQISSQFIAEGTQAMPIVFTSVKDDRYGAGGTFDTNRDGAASTAAPGNWGGLVFGPASSGSVAQARIFYGGGSVPIEGGFDSFNAIEIQGADARVVNSVLQFNEVGGSATDRNGRGPNDDATIFVRGAQPIIANNIIRDNQGPVLSINANAMQATLVRDLGQATGPLNVVAGSEGNYGPFVNGNRLTNNRINGMIVRGGTLTTETVWDDTDIAHILLDEVIVPNHQVYSGIRLQSDAQQSLVVKAKGVNAGITASGTPLDIVDRIGGTVQIVGQPGFPVVMTSLNDDSVSAGFDPNGLPMSDTDNAPVGVDLLPGQWRGIKLDQYSNDRNVAEVTEAENGGIGTNVDINVVDKTRTPQNAQYLGSLAPNLNSGDDTRRLGFQVDGTIALDNPADVDVYSFNADSGTEVWVDIDKTSYGLDAMVELVDSNGNVLARATDTNPDVSNPHNPIVPTDPGITNFTSNPNLVKSFNKDPYNGRDTYSTNVGQTVKTLTGTISSLEDTNPPNPPQLIEPGVTNTFPISIRSVAHGLASGDRVEISGVTGTTSANGVFTVTVLDANHFVLNGSLGNGVYTGGGAWAKLVTVTRDPIMRLVLPNAANGQPLINSPFFIRVRSQPKNNDFTGESGSTLNPGLTSGAYSMQLRLRQQDEKPGSTIRFANIRYATNAIEVHGLPYHSPLAGETVESDNTTNNNFQGAQNLGNLLQVDQNTLSVGGSLSSATDVDWYRFDLNFDLLQYVNGYTDGRKSWSTIFDLDYGDGLSRADTTLSVFDSTGKLILIGRDSDVQDDQGTSTANTSAGTFGKHDAYVGPAQLPAVVPGQTMTYYVAVSSDRMVPQVLDQTFNANATDSNVRLEPIESVARVVDDPLENRIRSSTTSSGTAEFPDSTFIDPDTTNLLIQPGSTLIDTTNVQALQANVRPFTLGDVQMFTTNGAVLTNVDPTVSIAYATAITDFQTTTITPGNALAVTDFDTVGAVTATFTAVSPGSAGNNIQLRFNKRDLGGTGPTITLQNFGNFNAINIVLDTNAQNISDNPGTGLTGTTVDQLSAAIADPANGVSNLIQLSVTTGNGGTDIGNIGSTANYSPLQLSGGSDTPGILKFKFFASQFGSQGNNIRLTFTRSDRTAQGGGVGFTVNNNNVINPTGINTINIALDTAQHGATGTTAGDLRNAIFANPLVNQLITGVIIQGGQGVDIANPPSVTPLPPLQLTGGSDGFGALEGTYAPGTRLATANNTNVRDLGFRSDGVLYGYEGINAANNGTAGQLILVDTGVGNASTAGTDSIPDSPAQPVVPATVQSVQNLTSSGGDAFAWGGDNLNNGVTANNTLLFYAVADPFQGASRLYQANPTSGSAAFVQNQQWGTNVTTVTTGIPPNTTTSLAAALITNATPAIGSTDFITASGFNPNPPVAISFRSKLLGTAANGGKIRFTASHNGFDQVSHLALPPTVTINTTLPPDISVNLNLDSANATKTATFSNSQNSTDIQFDAGLSRPGAQGNNIVINLSRANRGGQGPLVVFGGPDNNTISVTLDTSNFPGGDVDGNGDGGIVYRPGGPVRIYPFHQGTSAQQLVDAINDNIVNFNNNIVQVITTNGDVRIDNTPITNIQLTGGADPTTAQDVINAINAQAGQVISASLQSGSPSTVVALEDPNTPGAGKIYNDVTLTGGSGSPGFTTGLAFANDASTLYGVTDEGQFLINIDKFGTSAPASIVSVEIPNPLPSIPQPTLKGSNLHFSALALGPQNVEGGKYANMFFAMTQEGILTALDANGTPQQIFDSDGDGVADTTAILTGAALSGFTTGIAFSPFDFNLWHPTYRRQNDLGHDAGGQSGTATSRSNTIESPASGRQQDSINQSMYFGWEPWHGDFIDSSTVDSYNTYVNGNSPALGTGNVNLDYQDGQFGMLNSSPFYPSNVRQRMLSINPDYNHATYDLPVGAYGSLVTDKFSLATMSATDKPTFYFDYFLDTQNTNAGALDGNGDMRDSARVYIGPFTRFDSTGGPYVTGSVVDPTATATATKFSATSAVVLSGVDGFYKGKALQFTSGALNGQARIISDYIGATRTFVFTDGFTAAPLSDDTFRIAFGYVTWDLVATNNSVLDSPNSIGTREGELGTFVSASTSILPSNPRQQVQLMHDNTGEWRQSRVDLSRYAGQTNLQLRFDFSTAGQMPDSKGQLPLWPQDLTTAASAVNQRGVYPPTNVVAKPGQDYLYEDGFGRLPRIDLRQDNNHEGFYVDNIIIGPAERGEMVIGAPVNNTNFTDLNTNPITQPRNYDPVNTLPTQVLTGSYQLEIRRAAEYGLSDNGPLNDVNYSHNSQTPIISLDTNDRLIPDQRLGTPIPVESFETQNFSTNGLKWGSNDDAPWVISNVASAGNFSASSGKIGNGQSSGLSINLTTGGGNLTFDRSVDTQAGDVLRLFVDGRLATYTAVDGLQLATPQLAQWTGNIGFETITVPVSAGKHNFRWTYDKDSSDPTNAGAQDKVFIDNIRFPTPQIGFESIYEDASLHQVNNPNAATPPISPTIPAPNSFAQIHFIDTLFPGFTRGGDTNLNRQQGHVQIEMNQIYAASQVGILIDAARPQGQFNPAIGAVRNLPTLNSDRLVPGVTVTNNVVSNSGLTGIQYNGDPNTPINGLAAPVSAVPFGRIVNNTVYGSLVQTGTGIAVTNNAGPTLLNNIVANTSVGIAVDASSTNTTVLGANLYSNNLQDVPAGGSTGSNPIILAPNAPLFINPAAQNFYLASNSLAIDSSLNSLGDRASITTVKSSIGIPASPILSPDRDIYGQLRVDDPSQNPPPGLGQNVFKDRGAVERADFTNPTVSIVDPVDNDLNTPFHDRNRSVNDIAIRNENLTQFVIKLSDDGAGIDDATVDHTKFTITMDGVVLNDQVTAATLGVNPDYQFVYNAATDEAIFSPAAGIWPLNHTYRIIINNNPVGATDSTGNPLPAGIFDLAGNPLAANRDTGEASFSVFVGTLYDFGDAPSNLVNQHYPVTLVDGGAAHVVQDGYYLGTGISEESDAVQNATATADVDTPVNPNYSDGITFLGNPSPSKATTIVNTMTVVAHLPAGMTASKLDAWYDLNRDGDWTDAGEKLILTNTSHPGSNPNDIFDGTNTFTYSFGDATTAKGATFARFRLSPTGVSGPNFVVVNGVVPDGEVEDKQIFIGGAPFQNPKTGFARNELDVNDDGVISASDVLTIINWINATSVSFPTGKLTLGAPPIPNPALGPGKSLYVDVDGDTFMSASDVQIVITYINSQKSFSGEGGSANFSSAAGVDAAFDASSNDETASSSASALAAGNLLIPPVLVASPDVVLEVRDRSPVATLAVNQAATNDNTQDQALLAMNAANSLNESLALASNTKTAAAAIDSANEESWEDLLTSLAADHETKI